MEVYGFDPQEARQFIGDRFAQSIGLNNPIVNDKGVIYSIKDGGELMVVPLGNDDVEEQYSIHYKKNGENHFKMIGNYISMEILHECLEMILEEGYIDEII